MRYIHALSLCAAVALAFVVVGADAPSLAMRSYVVVYDAHAPTAGTNRRKAVGWHNREREPEGRGRDGDVAESELPDGGEPAACASRGCRRPSDRLDGHHADRVRRRAGKGPGGGRGRDRPLDRQRITEPGRGAACLAAVGHGDDPRDARRSYRKERGDPGVLVGVLDTGIDGSHPDIAPNFNAALSRNFTTDIPLVDGDCADEPDGSCNDPADVDENGHGTHVAGRSPRPSTASGWPVSHRTSRSSTCGQGRIPASSSCRRPWTR